MKRIALLIVDMQRDFMPGGSLAIEGADKLVPIINTYINSGKYDLVVATKDFHPENHISFADTHNLKVLDTITSKGIDQVLWPIHCVQHTKGSELHPDLDIDNINEYVTKGEDINIDSYSAFFDNAKLKETKLDSILKFHNIKEIHVCGVALDYCVKFTIIDSVSLGYRTKLLIKGTKAVVDDNIYPTMNELSSLGIEFKE